MGLSREEDDPDAVVHLRADAEAAAQRIVEFNLDPDQVVQVVRVLSEGLAKAAEAMRYTAFAAVLTLGATELQIAEKSEALVRELGPMVEDLLLPADFSGCGSGWPSGRRSAGRGAGLRIGPRGRGRRRAVPLVVRRRPHLEGIKSEVKLFRARRPGR